MNAEMAMVAERLASGATAQLPLPLVLRAAALEAGNRRVAAGLHELARRTETGADLATAVDAGPGRLPSVVVSACRAGLQHGELSIILDELNRISYKRRILGGRLCVALAYPAFQLVVLIFVQLAFAQSIGSWMALELARHAELFGPSGSPLEYVNRANGIMMSQAFSRYLWPLMGLFVAVLVAGALLGRPRWQFILARMPGVGAVWHWNAVWEWLATLRALVSRETPLDLALEASAESTSNAYVSAFARQVASRVRAGQSLAESLGNEGHMPPTVQGWIAWGESTQELACGLSHAIDSLEDCIRSRLNWLETVMPLVIILASAAAIVSWIAIAGANSVSTGSILAGLS